MPPDVAAAPAASGATATSQTQGTATPKPLNGNGKGTPAPIKGAESATKAPAKAETTDSSDWGDEQEKTFLDLLKRKSKADPKFRTRVKGEERGIESPDDLASLFTDAQRGRAATKTVEETKAQAAKLAEREKSVEAARAAFESGDPDAIARALESLGGGKAFHGVRAMMERQAEREKAIAELTPIERQLLQERESLMAERDQWQNERKQHDEAAKQAEEAKTIAGVRREATERATHILTTLKLPPEKLDVLGPHLITAMREAAEVGLELGRDVGPEQLLEYAQQRAAEVSTGFFTGLTPAQQYDALGEKTLAGLVREHLKRSKLSREAPAESQNNGAAKRQQQPATKKPALGDASYFFERKR